MTPDWLRAVPALSTETANSKPNEIRCFGKLFMEWSITQKYRRGSTKGERTIPEDWA